MKEHGLDITLKNNPDHILAPDDWDIILNAKFNKMPYKEFKTWYLNLLKSRWQTRREEFLELAKKGMREDIKLKCFCPGSNRACHAYIAADFMNALVSKLNKNQ